MRNLGTAIYVLGVILWVVYGGMLLAITASVARTYSATGHSGIGMSFWHVVILAALTIIPYGVLRLGKKLRATPPPP